MDTDHLLIKDLFDELDEDQRRQWKALRDGSPALAARRRRLQQLLNAYRAEGDELLPQMPILLPEPSTSTGARIPWLRVAAGLLLLVGAFLAGRLTMPSVVEHSGRQAEAIGTDDHERLRREIALLALRQDPVVERLGAIARLVPEATDDPVLAQALRRSLRDDPSLNVRMAALDVLFRHPELAPGADGLAWLVEHEPAELQRLALLEWIAAARPSGWRRLIAGAENDGSTLVRERARDLLRSPV